MSAAEVIEEIKRLPREERAKVEEFIRGSDDGERQVRYMDTAQAKELSGHIFTENAELFRKLAQ